MLTAPQVALPTEIHAENGGKTPIVTIETTEGVQIGDFALGFGPHKPGRCYPEPFSNNIPVAWSDYLGEYVILNFLEPWCIECMKDDELNLLYQLSNCGTIDVIGVSKDFGNKRYKEKATKVRFPMYADVCGIREDYGIRTVPTSIVIDPNGKIIGKIIGGISVKELEAIIEKSLSPLCE